MKVGENSRSDRGVRPWFVVASVFILLCVAATWMRLSASHRVQPSARLFESARSQPDTSAPTLSQLAQREQSSPTTRPAAAVSLPPAKPYPRQLVRALSRVDQGDRPLTPEEAEQWKLHLLQLIEHGADGAAAIAEFLQTNTDIRFGRAGIELLGVDSLREALFDALVQIGGPAAISATLQTLQTTADPREIALLARNLDTLAPEAYRADALSAAREVLTTAASGKLPESDMAPLFEVLQRYGGPDVAPELQQAARTWPYYSAIALGSLPDGAGIPSLAQMAESNEAEPTMALRLLAQLSGKHGSAQLTLLGRAQAGSIPPSTWPLLVTSLAGNEYQFENSVFADPPGRGNVTTQMSVGNQRFYNAFTPARPTQEELNARVAFIYQLRSALSEPAALDALQQAEELLMTRLLNITASR